MTEENILPIVYGCAIVGVFFLVLGIINGIRILQLLHYNRRWMLLVALMVFFIVGYIGYVIILHIGIPFEVHLLISTVFLVGALFVFLIVLTSLRTVADIKRVSLFKELAATDSLTFLHNRRIIDERLDDEIRRAIRYERPLSIMMIDIDHFKNVNDSLGHQCGDTVLVSLSRLLCLNLRHIDIVGRYGGEEFLVILPETSAEMALPVAERLRQSVARARFRCAHVGEHKNPFRHLLEHKAAGPHEQADHDLNTENAHGQATKIVPGREHIAPAAVEIQPTGADEIAITISIGLATLRENQVDSRRELVAEADANLYRAKRSGRNRVANSNR